MIDFAEIEKNGEIWELFARDFLTELGFYIESSIDRGPDGKKDIIVSENLKGNLGKYKFKWLVSCKHFANRKSSNSVTEENEPNILERVKSFKCDGFIGFYSTVPSSGLNTRLNQLKESSDIKDYRIFDYKLIENKLITIGFSELLMRYFPISYKKVKPLHILYDKYLDLRCKNCNADLLQKIYEDSFTWLVAFVIDFKNETKDGRNIEYEYIEDVYWACKGICDSKIDAKLSRLNKITVWEDIDDLVIPVKFMQWIFAIMNGIENESVKYDEVAFKKLKEFIMAISQKVLREMTEKERERFITISNLPF